MLQSCHCHVNVELGRVEYDKYDILKYFDVVNMNRGEGAKNAAKAKSGQIGILLFKDTKPNKKFGYKKRGQTYSVRKVTTAQDSQAKNTPALLKKPATKNSTFQKSHTQEAKETGSKWSKKTTSTSEGKLTGKEFVKRNVQKVSQKTDDSKDQHTIALTQDQLNAILKSIGRIAGGEKVASIEIDDGHIKVNTADGEPVDESNQDSKSDKKEDNEHTMGEDAEDISPFPGSEHILSLLGKISTTLTSSPGSSTKPSTPASAANTVSSKPLKERSAQKMVEHRKEGAIKDVKTADDQTGTREEDNGRVEFAQLSLAERKRRKWKQEQDEQVLLKRQQALQDKHVREVVASKMGVMHHEMGIQEHHERSHTASRNASQADTTTSSSREHFCTETSPRNIAPSSLGIIETQRVVPAAMRSSFLIGGQGSAGSRLYDHNAQVKRRQQQEWLEELEQQRIEAHERKEHEKKRQQKFESNLTQQWADPVELSKTRQSIGHHREVHDDSATYRQTEGKVDKGEEIEQRHSAPLQGSEVRDDIPSERSHIRAHNLLLDPAEIERREVQRVKHIEHMLAVKAQVEEKQRVKREAEERRRQGEADEERQLAQQRMNLQNQFESEKEKKRKKEDNEAERHRVLAEGMQAAYNEAQKEKQQKRIEKLTKMGHDTSNLRSSWDNQQSSSPRKQDSNSQVANKGSPRTQQPTVPQPVQHPPRVPLPFHVTDDVISQAKGRPVMVDAFTSPVYDQAVQTEFHFPPYGDVTRQGGLLMREPSAHIEYKPDGGITTKEAGRKEKKTEYKGKRITKEETQTEVNTQAMRQTRQSSRATSEQEDSQKKSVKKSEKPVWGACTRTKKLQRNSDKDLTANKKKREERKQQRAAELLAEQERNAPGRLLRVKKPVAAADVQPGTVQGSKPTQSSVKGSQDRNGNHKPHRGRTESIQDRAGLQTWTEENSDLPDTPPLKDGDFVPFLRSDEPLIREGSVPVTPESQQMLRHRHRLLAQNEKDPLLNPDRLKDTEQRQERILQQLSHLRQGLMMKQREMELGLTSPV